MPRRPTSQIDVNVAHDKRIVTSQILIYTAFVARAIKKSIQTNSQFNVTQYCILLSLLRSGSCLRVSQVAEELSLSSSAVVVAASRLVECGLISRKTDEDDKRNTILIVTDVGQQTVKELDETVVDAINNVWHPLTTKQKKTMLKSALKAVKNNRRIRIDRGQLRADTAYAEGMIMSINAFSKVSQLHGMKLGEAMVLARVAEFEEPMSMGQLAHELLMKPNYLSVLCKLLAKRSLIVCGQKTGDRRVALVAILPAGKERISRLLLDFEKIVRDGFFTSTTEEQQCFIEVADAIVANELEHRRFD